MSFLGYSKILELLTGVKDYELENSLILMSKHKFSDLRYNCLKSLAKLERGTIAGILRKLKENTSGGTYITVHKFFILLEKDGLLVKEEVGRRTYWKFSGEMLKKFLLV